MGYFFFIVKILIVLGGVLWASYMPGDITLEWGEYLIKFSLRTYVGFTLTLLFLLLTLYDAYKDLYNRIKLRMERKSHAKLTKFYHKLLESFMDLELHNTTLINREVSYLQTRHGEDPLALYYRYRAALREEPSEEMDQLVQKLQMNPLLKPLAFKIDIRKAISLGNYTLALTLTEEAIRLFPSAWFYKSAIFLCINSKEFEKALDFLREGSRAYDFNATYEHYLFSIIWFQYAKAVGPDHEDYTSYLQKAHDYNLTLVRASVRLAEAYAGQGQLNRAKDVLLETWDVQKASFSVAMAYANLGESPIEQVQYAKEFAERDPEAPISHIVLVMKYINAQLWAEAQRELDVFRQKHGSYEQELDYLTAILAHDELGEAERAYEMLKEMIQTKLRLKWHCKYCGHQAEVWQPFCESCDRFDHVDYDQAMKNPMVLPFIP